MILYKSICLNNIINIKNKQMDKNNLVKELILFYVTENYKKYLQDNNIVSINEDQIPDVIEELYSDRKQHLKIFLKDSLNKMQGENYMGDLVFQNLCLEIFQDDELCKARLVLEIKLFQEKEK